MTDLARIEAVLDEAGLAAQLAALEARLPIGVRPRQCSARTLLVGMLACLSHGHQSAHLTAVHAALLGLDEKDQIRLGVLSSWGSGRHALTYRQIEYTAGLIFGSRRWSPTRAAACSPSSSGACRYPRAAMTRFLCSLRS